MKIKNIITGIIAAAVLTGVFAGVAGCGRQESTDADPTQEDLLGGALPTATQSPTATPVPTSTPTPTPEPVYHDEDEWQDAYAEFLPGKKSELSEYIYENVIGMWDEPVRGEENLSFIEDKLFLLYDLDRSGIPELILINGEVLTYRRGELKLFEETAELWTYWYEHDDIDLYDVGIPDDGSAGLFVYDSTTYLEGRDLSEILMRISLSEDVLSVNQVYAHDSGYDSYTRSVYQNGYDSEGRYLNPLQSKWLMNRHTYSETLAFKDITEENIQTLIYEYAAPDVPQVPSAELRGDELLYAGVFDRMVDVLGIFYSSNLSHITEISQVSYAFFDIDGNGVNELIISDGAEQGAFVYTVIEGETVELANFNGNRRKFIGVNEAGYICGSETSGDYESARIFYEIADDGSSLVQHSLSVNVRDSDNIRYSYLAGATGVAGSAGGAAGAAGAAGGANSAGSQSITEAEYNEYTESFTAPLVKPEWKKMTYTTGRG